MDMVGEDVPENQGWLAYYNVTKTVLSCLSLIAFYDMIGSHCKVHLARGQCRGRFRGGSNDPP